MGLVLSVLVVCVGVYKFIQIYGDPGRIVSYEKKTEICHADNASKNSDADRPTPRVQLCRDFLSHEDVEIECTSKVLKQDSAAGTSKRFLVTEKDDEEPRHSRTPSPRKFLITKEDEQDPELREFLIAKGKSKDGPNVQRFVLIDTKEGFRDTSPLPLPKKFVITEKSESFNQETLRNLKKGIQIGFNSLRYMGKNIDNIEGVYSNQTQSATFSKSANSHPYNKEPNQNSTLTVNNEISSTVLQIYNNTPEEFHRDPSPYPNLNVAIRKGSISMDMLDTSKVNMNESDEEQYTSSNKIDVITKTGDFNTTEYMSNQVLVMPPGDSQSNHQAHEVWENSKKDLHVPSKEIRSKSASRPATSTTQEEMRRVSSSSKMYEKDFEEPSSLFINVLKKGEDEEFRNSLDGVKRGSEARRSFRKKKNRSQNSLGN